MSSLFQFPVEFVELSSLVEDLPRGLRPGDAILFPHESLAYTLVELLIDDGCHQTWEVMTTASVDPHEFGKRAWFGFSTRKPLLADGVVVRNS